MFLQRQFHRNNQIGGDIMDSELPYLYIVDNILINKDLSMGIGWKLDMPLFITKDDSARATSLTELSSMFNALPDNFDFQILWMPKHNMDSVLDKINSYSPKASMLKAFQQEQSELIARRANKGLIRRYSAYIFLVRKCDLQPGELTRRVQQKEKAKKGETTGKLGKLKDSIFDLFSLLHTPDSSFYYEQEFEDAKKDLFGQASSIERALGQFGYNPSFLLEDDMLEVLYYAWNPFSWEKGLRPRKYEPGRYIPVTDYIIQSPYVWDSTKGYYEMDGALHRILTLRVPPEYIDVPQLEAILYDSSIRNISVTTTVQGGSVEKRIAKLTNELPLIRARAHKDPRLVPTLQQLQSEIISLAEQNERVWHGTHIIHIWSDSADELDNWTRELKRLGLQCNGMQIVQEEHALWEYTRFSTPGWTRDTDKYRQHIYNTSQMVGLLPICGQPDRFDQPALGVVLETSTGGMYNMILHDQKNLNNFNCVIIGTSGTGKSFLASTIMAQLQRSDVRILGIDLGGSYRGLCASLGGAYVTMDIDSANQRVNPLQFPPNVTLEPSDLERMLLFIEKLIVDPAKGQTRLGKDVMADLDEALRQVFAQAEGREVFLHDFQALVAKSFNKDVGKILQPWVGHGRHAKLFDGTSQISFDNPFTIFDLSLVKDNRDIAPLALMSIINGINAMARKYPKQPKLLLIDEAWFMLQDPIIGKFVSEAFRTFRKTGTGIIGISQGIEEWTNLGAEKDAILNNTATFIILKQSSNNAVEAASRELTLNPQESGLIRELVTIPGEASQALLRQQRSDGTQESIVIINRPTPLLYAMSTTNRQDRNKIEDIKEEGFSYVEALVEFSKRFPKGTMFG